MAIARPFVRQLLRIENTFLMYEGLIVYSRYDSLLTAPSWTASVTVRAAAGQSPEDPNLALDVTAGQHGPPGPGVRKPHQEGARPETHPGVLLQIPRHVLLAL